VENSDTYSNTTIEGVTEFRGQDLLLTTAVQMTSGRYHVHLEAKPFLAQRWLRIGGWAGEYRMHRSEQEAVT